MKIIDCTFYTKTKQCKQKAKQFIELTFSENLKLAKCICIGLFCANGTRRVAV
jgi:hypothetical protein